MKKLIVFTLIFLSAGLFLNAQKFEPTTQWPYVFKDFMHGVVYFKDGQQLPLNLNIHLLESKLHYVKDDMIYHADDSNPIDSVIVQGQKFINVNNQMMRVISQQKGNSLVLLQLGDFDVLYTSTGAYGTPAHTSSVRDLSSFEIGGISNMNHRKLVLEKEDGKPLPVKTTYLFEINGNQVVASKKGFKDFLDADTNTKFEQFVKDNKINWKKPGDLDKILTFF